MFVYVTILPLVGSNRKGLKIDIDVISKRGVNINELKFKFFDTPDKCLFYLESQALQYIQFKDNNAEYRRLIDEAGLNMRIAFSIESFPKTATPEHTDLVKRIRNNDFKTSSCLLCVFLLLSGVGFRSQGRARGQERGVRGCRCWGGSTAHQPVAS